MSDPIRPDEQPEPVELSSRPSTREQPAVGLPDRLRERVRDEARRRCRPT